MVVGLPVVVLEFPVGAPLPVLAVPHARGAEIGAVDQLLQWPDILLQRRRVLVDVDEDPVVPRRGAYRRQPELAAVKVAAGTLLSTIEIWSRLQAAVERIGPGVVRA